VLAPRLLVVGWRENVFHHAPVVEFFETFDLALEALVEARKERR
jgi:hypothetical protein